MTKAKTAQRAAGAKNEEIKGPMVKKSEAKNRAAPEEKSSSKKPARDKPVTRTAEAETKAGQVSGQEVKIAPGFSNSGLGIKTSGKKPALSIAPGVMILGRSAQAKPETNARPSDRRLSKKEMGDIREFLCEKRERLLSGMRRELAMQKERAQSKAADEVDKATDAYDEDLSFEIAAANDQELHDIQVALEKIDKGTYGQCEVCGCGISPSRLKILPSATTCVSCRGQEEMIRRRDDNQQLFSMMEDGDGEGESM